jgi:predicted CoA-binding protein
MSRPVVAVVGASADRRKFGNKAVRAYAAHGYEVHPVNPRGGAIEGLAVSRRLGDVPVARLDRVLVYLPPERGLEAVGDLVGKPAGELWLNPGADSRELVEELRCRGANVVLGCSIVALGASPADYPA